MSIGKQLITMLGIAIFGIIAVFSIGMTKMEQVYEKTNTCNVNSLPSVLLMGDMSQDFNAMRITIWEHISSHDKGELKALETKFKEYKTSFDLHYKKYSVLLSDDKDREFYKDAQC